MTQTVGSPDHPSGGQAAAPTEWWASGPPTHGKSLSGPQLLLVMILNFSLPCDGPRLWDLQTIPVEDRQLPQRSGGLQGHPLRENYSLDLISC